MKKNQGKNKISYIRVAVAEDAQLAEDYISFLHGNGLLAKLEKLNNGEAFSAYILVPEKEYELAYDMINARNEYDHSDFAVFDSRAIDESEVQAQRDQFLFIDPNRAA